MTITERFFFSNWNIKRYARKVLAWDRTRSDKDECKMTCASNARRAIKAEVVKGVLTFTVHVRTRDNGSTVWKYRKYSIIMATNDVTPLMDGDIVLDDTHVIRPGRSGKYNFKQ